MMVNRKLKQELELRDKMFQDFREMKEKELSELRKINQDLEKRLHSLVHPNETVSLLDQQRGICPVVVYVCNYYFACTLKRTL